MDWRIAPFIGIDSIRFGELRAMVRSAMGDGFAPFRKGGRGPVVDAYDGLGLHLHYDDSDHLECIEAFEPATLSFFGVALVGRPAAPVIEELAGRGVLGRDVDMGYQFDEHGFSLFVPQSKIEGVSVFRRGYFDLPAA